MMGFRTLLLKELREQIRTFRLLAVAAVFVLFGILSPVTDRYMKQLLDAVGQQSAGMTFTVPPPSLQGVADPKVAGPAILPLVVSSGVSLVRFARARPSLEDVFLRLVAESGPAVAPAVTIPVTGLDGRGRR